MSKSMGAMRYVGDGAFFVGVPARDLTAEEAERYGEIIAGSSLYEPVGAAQAVPVAAENESGEGDKKRSPRGG